MLEKGLLRQSFFAALLTYCRVVEDADPYYKLLANPF